MTQEGDFIPNSISERSPEGYQQGAFGEIHEIRQGQARCNTCGQPAGAPFRRHDPRGKVLYGCIDAFHNGHLVPCSESSFFHNQKPAQKARKLKLDYQKALHSGTNRAIEKARKALYGA